MLKFMKKVVKNLPVLKKLFLELDQYRKSAPMIGHFYSPIPSQEEVKARENVIWGPKPKSLLSIDLNEEGQVALFNEFKAYYKEMPFEKNLTNGFRYYLDNGLFGFSDGIILYSMIRHLKPKRIIEIGSGYSSAAMLDTNDLFFDGTIDCTFVEPYPKRLLSLLKPADLDRHRLVRTRLQEVDLNLFTSLSANDILFVDSSHVTKIDSDVNRIIFDILPILERGVWVHFHDIHYPFEYPKDWIYRGTAWNESYILRAFLQYNSAFQIQFFNSFMTHFHEELFLSHMPQCLGPNGSIWLKKI
jgi:predicted O-methyltransferase YrrM